MTERTFAMPARGLQPFLHDGVVALRAPTQVWSRADGNVGAGAIDGIYHGDTRFIRTAAVAVTGGDAEWLGMSAHEASRVVFEGLLRGLDDLSADPKMRLLRERTVDEARVTEQIKITSHLTYPIDAEVTLTLRPEFSPMHAVKAGMPESRAWSERPGGAGTVVLTAGPRRIELETDGSVRVSDSIEADTAVVVTWAVQIPPGRSVTVAWGVRMTDDALVVRSGSTPPPPAVYGGGSIDDRAERWLATALTDLNALRLALPDHPDDEFYAAGAPWFFTLFGRDSLWAARLALHANPTLAASTLRVLARRQGRSVDPATAEEPGKILHELRAEAFDIPGEGFSLPPVYYGSVDATALWVGLFGDAVDAGLPEADVRELLPAMQRCLAWIMGHGDGFVSYYDGTGRGLANQGWKDSGDSIQWRDGALAQGPIALCEVQGYAYEAVMAGARILDAYGESGGDAARAWGARLRRRFADRFWVSTPEGDYPAIALDASGRGVDALTSNIGHLLGTGLLEPHQERDVAALLTQPSMLSGFGIRTMSTGAHGYWPLSYHGGSVWIHDTAIIARGMQRAGLAEAAEDVVENMLAAAAGFDYRVPELHSGDPAGSGGSVPGPTTVPLPYPAACRPQAWSAASAVTAFEFLSASH
ncbi:MULTISPECIES: glycogen debranching N-terminal domain-containing protein [unclassified Microbacterium]|uniref:glycogen debranching N-terminal domain-containing protein n=1 Tax=unclassified Microbacterium TaxID=2609290 RepID=UPI00214B7023|nr:MULTISPECIES: glycogen debranching N-terminal domain-containing protein [unclassified Microbacterium]MCR2809571.1 amylo-alpha-1,6-glucosidase [Microbacterium sp. zg.B185]WIM18103.1 glycogen debranching N-terminal domain-containing protein [Microbacterium sp. zg-B185]